MFQRTIGIGSGGGGKNILALWDLDASGATGDNTLNNGYNEDIFEYVSGGFRPTNIGTGTITLKSKVSGTLNIKRALGTTWGSLTINGSTITNAKNSQVPINVGDTVVWAGEQYYQQIVISYTK